MTTKLNLPHIFFLAITQISYTMLYGEQKKIHTHTHTHTHMHTHTHTWGFPGGSDSKEFT